MIMISRIELNKNLYEFQLVYFDVNIRNKNLILRLKRNITYLLKI